MKTKILIALLFILNFSVFSQEQKMTAAEIATFKATVEKETKTVKSLKTDFTQYKHMDFLSKDIETSGKMAFKTPNLLNWQYTKPYQYSIVFKNNKYQTVLTENIVLFYIKNETPTILTFDKTEYQITQSLDEVHKLFSNQLKNAVAFSFPTNNFSSVGTVNFRINLREK